MQIRFPGELLAIPTLTYENAALALETGDAALAKACAEEISWTNAGLSDSFQRSVLRFDKANTTFDGKVRQEIVDALCSTDRDEMARVSADIRETLAAR